MKLIHALNICFFLFSAALAQGPNIPKNVAAKGGYNGNVVVWTYSDTNGDIVPAGTTYNLYRATTTGGQDLNSPYKTGLVQPSYNDDQVISGQAYFYNVRARDSGGTLSAASAEVTATPTIRTLPTMSADDKFLFGDLIPWGDRRNPYGWHDYWYETLGRQWAGQFPTRPPGANPIEKKAGTISVVQGSNQIVGVGTAFLTDMVGVEFIVPEVTGIPRYVIIASVQDNTHLTLTSNYKYETASGVTYGTFPAGQHDIYFNRNYYDSIYVMYEMYYRTGDTYWQTEARRMADSWYNYAFWGEGTATVPQYDDISSPRGQGLLGIVARARDGRPEMWPAIEDAAREYYAIWLGPRLAYPSPYFGVRDPGYALLYCAVVGKLSPTPSVRTEFTQYALNAAKLYFARLQKPDGGWYWGDGNSHRTWHGEVSQPFHVGLLLDGMQRTYELTGDAEVLNSVLSATQWMYNRGFDAQTRIRATVYFVGWKPYCDVGGCYYDQSLDTSGRIDSRANSYTAIHQYFWAYRQTGNQKYKQWGDEVFDATFGYTDMLRANITFSTKQYGEGGRTTHRAIGDRLAPSVPSSPIPIAPIECQATWISGTTVKVDWTHYNPSEVSGFRVERKLTTTWSQIADLPGNTLRSYPDTTAANGNAYQYRVVAYNANGASYPSIPSAAVTVSSLVASQIVITTAQAGNINNGTTRQFTATVLDQFGNALSVQPQVDWDTNRSEYATISTSGLLTAVGVSPAYEDPIFVAAYLHSATPPDAFLSNIVIVPKVVTSGASANTQATVALSLPAYNQVVNAPISLTATATEPDGSIAKVEFWDGSYLLGTATSSPYSIVFNPTGVLRAQIHVKARVYDNTNQSGLLFPFFVDSETRSFVISSGIVRCNWHTTPACQ